MMKLFLIIFGIALGFLCGFVPGIHPNTAGAIIYDIFGSGETTAIILIGILGAYSAISFIPAIFLGVPEGDTQVSVLPGQRMLREGRAVEALYVISFSLCACAIICIPVIFLIKDKIAIMFEIIRPFTGWILIFLSLILVGREKNFRRVLFAFIVFMLSGILGIMVFGSHLVEPLFPMFVGFFAIPALLRHKDSEFLSGKKVEQNYSVSFLPYVFIGIVLGAIADFLPGISTPAQLAVFVSILDRNLSTRNFLAHVAAIDVSHTIFSISSASVVGIARVGAVAIASKAYAFNPENMILFLGVFICGLGAGVLFLLRVGGEIEKLFLRVKFEPIAKILCLYLFFLAFIFGGMYGVLVMIVSSLVGFLPIFWRVSRTHVMGSIILASILRAFIG